MPCTRVTRYIFTTTTQYSLESRARFPFRNRETKSRTDRGDSSLDGLHAIEHPEISNVPSFVSKFKMDNPVR